MNPVLVAVIERLMDDVGDKIAVDVPMGALTVSYTHLTLPTIRSV